MKINFQKLWKSLYPNTLKNHTIQKKNSNESYYISIQDILNTQTLFEYKNKNTPDGHWSPRHLTQLKILRSKLKYYSKKKNKTNSARILKTPIELEIAPKHPSDPNESDPPSHFPWVSIVSFYGADLLRLFRILTRESFRFA